MNYCEHIWNIDLSECPYCIEESKDKIMENIKKAEKIKDVVIPLINLNEIQITEDICTNIFYGINNPSTEIDALKLIEKEISKYNGEFVYMYDFRNGTIFGSRKWYMQDQLNVYENTEATPNTSLIMNNNNKYEKVFWCRIFKEK